MDCDEDEDEDGNDPDAEINKPSEKTTGAVVEVSILDRRILGSKADSTEDPSVYVVLVKSDAEDHVTSRWCRVEV
ncbi:hypothetical protein AVEN_125239-1 [Araneus ventricosus]|uniref:Uncharacterized protein n=1 Tax=Araneus ventricosus TaxID=182803 RepID=A0A4Y2M6D4_ARAVE|nr:hypothetical protein AVEN_125239-1 [Araneus ventricosus]